MTGARSPKAPAITIVVEEPRWREDTSLLRLIRRAVRRAMASPPHVRSRRQARANPLSRLGGEGQGEGTVSTLTVLLSNDKKLRALNAGFRGKDKPTNVLSFPSAGAGGPYLGDIALGYGVLIREARAQKKELSAHAAHLAIHGTLHLLGYDHEKARDAKAMEALEIELLAALGIADPYAPRPLTRPRKAA
jgi:probable rRNA maturation factor